MKSIPETALPYLYTMYSEKGRETWQNIIYRTLDQRAVIERLTQEQLNILYTSMDNLLCLPPSKILSDYTSYKTNMHYDTAICSVNNIEAFKALMLLNAKGIDTVAMLEDKYIQYLPPILHYISVSVIGELGTKRHVVDTCVYRQKEKVLIEVGDSIEGWADTYIALLKIAMGKEDIPPEQNTVEVIIDISRVWFSVFSSESSTYRRKILTSVYNKTADLLARAFGRQLRANECALLVSCASEVTNIKLSQWSSMQPDRKVSGKYVSVYHNKPSLDECLEEIKSQFNAGKGVMQWAGESVARANTDIIDTYAKKVDFLNSYANPTARRNYLSIAYENKYGSSISQDKLECRENVYGLNPIEGVTGFNSKYCIPEVQANMFNSVNEEEQLLAIEAGALWALLMMDTSRQDDPALAIGLTGIFDFFVRKFGRPWLEWWAQERVRTNPDANYFLEQERLTLGKWFSKAKDTVETYCIQHGLKMPTRFTCIKQSIHSLTNASPGWLPPTATRYIRKLKYCAYHPVALACIDYGYNVVCSPDCTDEQGIVFRNIYNNKATEWVVEIPVEVPWSDIAEGIDFNFSAIAQLDFYKVLQTSWSNHQSACMIRASKDELEALATCVYESIQYDGGFVSIGVNNEANEESISKELYNFLTQDVELRRTEPDFFKALKKYTSFLHCADFGLACKL